MPLYRYEGFNRKGEKAYGTFDAATLQTAKEILQAQGVMPTKISELVAAQDESFWSGLFQGRVEVKSVIMFTKQLSVLLRSAVPLLQAIELLSEQFEGKFKRILVQIKDGLKAGEPFAKELGKHPRVFSNVYVQLVKAGEATGKLDIILDRLTKYLEKIEETKKTVKKAMAYPIMMITVSIIVVIGMLTVLVPRLKGMFEKMGKELPAPTQFLIDLSNFFTGNAMALTVGAAGTIIGFLYWRSTLSGKYKIDELLLRFPLTSYFSKTKAVVQFCKTLGMLLESGVNLAEALDIVCNIVENKVLTQKLLQARDKIIKEGKIAKYLKETGLFPSIASYMISTGEQSGKLAEMLTTVGNDYDVELTELTESITSKITPIMTVVMAVIVGFIVVSMFLPILSMSDIAGI